MYCTSSHIRKHINCYIFAIQNPRGILSPCPCCYIRTSCGDTNGDAISKFISFSLIKQITPRRHARCTRFVSQHSMHTPYTLETLIGVIPELGDVEKGATYHIHPPHTCQLSQNATCLQSATCQSAEV